MIKTLTILSILFAFTLSVDAQTYTLKDSDVKVDSGAIVECIIPLEGMALVIPEKLQGQTITIIGESAFEKKGIRSVSLPSTIEEIQGSAFMSNNLESLDFSNCKKLRGIGESAFAVNANLQTVSFAGCEQLSDIQGWVFYRCSVKSIDFSGCTQIIEINTSSFSGVQIETLDLSGCKNLEVIGRSAFSRTETLKRVNLSGCTKLTEIKYSAFTNCAIEAIDFTGCTSLQIIKSDAFEDNEIKSVDLSPCTSLVTINRNVFGGNSLESAILPNLTTEGYFGWVNKYGKDIIDNKIEKFNIEYRAKIKYTLTDADVEMKDGYIKEYHFKRGATFIDIPEMLHGQKVIGISDVWQRVGVFASASIYGVQFPASLEYIGKDCFMDNEISEVDFANLVNLKCIEAFAFSGNKIEEIDLSNCRQLISIKENAFEKNEIIKVELPQSGSLLMEIENEVFKDNKLTQLDFSNCSHLSFVGANLLGTIESNPLSIMMAKDKQNDVVLPAFHENDKKALWKNAKGEELAKGSTIVKSDSSYYYIDKWYTLRNEDVEVEDGMIIKCTNFIPYKKLIVPKKLHGQDVTEIKHFKNALKGIFAFRGIVELQLPATIEYVGGMAFVGNPLRNIDFSRCTNLTNIGYFSFAQNKVSTNLEVLDFSSCTSLEYISDNAFKQVGIKNIIFDNCTKLNYIGRKSFFGTRDSLVDLSSCISLRNVGEEAFKPAGSINQIILPKATYEGTEFVKWNEYRGPNIAEYYNKRELFAEFKDPILLLSDELIFDKLSVGDTLEQFFYIDNFGEVNAIIESVEVPEWLSINWTSGTVKSHDWVEVTATFNPTQKGKLEGVIKIQSSNTVGEKEIKVSTVVE